MKAERLILHLDMDAFFASVEQAANPQWRNRPVVICGSGRSVVATASYEARKLGIRSGQPVAEARRLASTETVFLPGNHPKYLWIATRILRMLEEYSPLVEPYSIDEAFVDLTGNPNAQADPAAVAREIQRRLEEDFGLTGSIGIGNSKLIAKIASDQHKPNGLTVVSAADTIPWLHSLDVECLPGLGPKTTACLHGFNIHSVAELALVDEAVLVSWFGQNGSILFRMAWGRDDTPVIAQSPPLKSLSQEWTLPADSKDRTELEEVLSWLAELVGRRLRDAGMAGRTVTVKLREADFTTYSRSQTVEGYLCLDQEIGSLARSIFTRNWRGQGIRLLGVKISNLRPFVPFQNRLGLWKDSRGRGLDLANTVDWLKNKYGETALSWASSLALAQRR